MRRATRDEAEAVLRTLDQLTEGLGSQVAADRDIVVVEGEPARVLLASSHLATLDAALWTGAEAGIPIGTLEEGQLHLDMQGAALVAGVTRRNTVRVREKVAHLVAYGRGVLAPSVLDHDPALRPGDTCIIVDPRRQAIGLGTVVGSFKGTGEVVRPLHDLGRYLRDQDT